MNNGIFIDTWGRLSLRDKKEDNHLEAVRLYKDYEKKGEAIYTTDYVMDETLTLFFKRLSPEAAKESMNLLFKAIEENRIQLERITSERFYRTKELRERFMDKPEISFTDLSSTVVMQELKISYIMTGDAHFGHVNLGFKTIPETP